MEKKKKSKGKRRKKNREMRNETEICGWKK